MQWRADAWLETQYERLFAARAKGILTIIMLKASVARVPYKVS